ncbi:MAG: HAMP domain-containing sensor histidine kinase, partial [Roseiflexaceae bacterium]
MSPVTRMRHSGQPVLLNERPQEISDIYAGADAQQALIQQLAPHSLLMLPFVVRGTTIGVFTLYATRTMRRYTPDDLALAEELVRRAAMALDNAQLYHEAQAAIREREAFLLVASHEVKNPLTALLGHAQVLQRKLTRRADSARELEDITTIIDQSKRIDRLLSELLDASQVTGAQFRIDPIPLDLGSLLRRVVAQAQPSAPNHCISISEQATMLAIAGDANRLEQVFQNLISNAIKYSPAGGAITVAIAKQDARARITVRDEGLGIPAAALPHVFKRFYRVAGTSTQQIAGSGIGLYVVREIVTGHGGTVEASSIEGGGSTFTVYLPLALVEKCV